MNAQGCRFDGLWALPFREFKARQFAYGMGPVKTKSGNPAPQAESPDVATP